MKILPSLASANPMCLEKEIQRLKDYPYLHFDIEDGNFVPNITFGMKTIKAAAALSKASFDAHLMVTNPLDYIEELSHLGFKAAAFHWEAAGYPLRIINKIKKYGMKAGIAINPATEIRETAPYLRKVDYVLVMTSEPDGEGDLYQEEMQKKVKWLAENKSERMEIIVDGGIREKELMELKKAGATMAVMGRYAFHSEDPVQTMNALCSL